MSLKQYLINSKYQIAKFFIIGLSSTVLDLVLLVFLKEQLGLTPVAAVAVNQIFVISYNFLLNKYWSFQSRKLPLRQLARYLILVLINYFASIGLMYIFYNLIGLDYRIVRITTIALLFVFNFIAYKHWVYQEK